MCFIKRIFSLLDRALINYITYTTIIPNYDHSFGEILKQEEEFDEIYLDEE